MNSRKEKRMFRDMVDWELTEVASELAGHSVQVIWTSDLKKQGVDGLAEYDRIFISRDAPMQKHAFIFWHELAHIMLGHAQKHTDSRYKTTLEAWNRESGHSYEYNDYPAAAQPKETAADRLTIQLVRRHQPDALANVRFYIEQRGLE